ncbi:MAG TPA: U32 family peptidase [Devosia sp.]|nr:U32 family peptidase [Devosia sp.]
MTKRPSLSFGPLLFLWDGPKWRDFYFRIADEAPVQRVIIGEVVCSKRFHFMAPYMDAVIARLESAGKEVRQASLALVTLPREVEATRTLVAQAQHPIEAGDLSALALLNGQPHSIGPLINVYNAHTARALALRGADTICLTPELPFTSVRSIVEAVPHVDFEVFAFGKVPLAISARCAHARAKGRTKDNCGFVCIEDPDGLAVDTLDDQPFLALNGVQTVSHTCQSLLGQVQDLASAGVRWLRLSPQDCDMVAIARIFDEVICGRLAVDEALIQQNAAYPAAAYSNGFHFGREGVAWVPQAANE